MHQRYLLRLVDIAKCATLIMYSLKIRPNRFMTPPSFFAHHYYVHIHTQNHDCVLLYQDFGPFWENEKFQFHIKKFIWTHARADGLTIQFILYIRCVSTTNSEALCHRLQHFRSLSLYFCTAEKAVPRSHTVHVTKYPQVINCHVGS